MMTIAVDDRDLVRGIREMQRRGMDLRVVKKEMRRAIGADLKAHNTGPDGAWAKWSRSYVDKKARQGKSFKKRVFRRTGRRVLTARGRKRFGNMLGRLKTSWSIGVDKSLIEIKNRVPWAAVHHFGGSIGRGRRVVARPFLYISDAAVRSMSGIIEGQLATAWNGSAGGFQGSIGDFMRGNGGGGW